MLEPDVQSRGRQFPRDAPTGWCWKRRVARPTNLLVWDVIFDGDTRHRTAGWHRSAGPRASRRETKSTRPWLSAGGQSRDISVSVDQSLCGRPGIRQPSQLSPNCTIKTGVLAFGIPGDNANTSRTVYALFGEFALPVTDSINMQAATPVRRLRLSTVVRRSIRSSRSSGRRSIGWHCAVRSRRRSAARRFRT